jgi:hypothetical protein
MRQKIISLMSLLAIGILLAGCMSPGEERQDEMEDKEPVEGVDYLIKPAEPGWNWYINKVHNYKVKYPTDWRRLKTYPEGFIIHDPQVGTSWGSFGVGAVPLKECEKELSKEGIRSYDRWEVAKWFLEATKRKKQDVQLLELTNISLGGIPATKIVCSYTYTSSQNPERKYRMLDVMIYPDVKDGKVYDTSYSASRDIEKAETLYEYAPVVEQMIDSFEFI